MHNCLHISLKTRASTAPKHFACVTARRKCVAPRAPFAPASALGRDHHDACTQVHTHAHDLASKPDPDTAQPSSPSGVNGVRPRERHTEQDSKSSTRHRAPSDSSSTRHAMHTSSSLHESTHIPHELEGGATVGVNPSANAPLRAAGLPPASAGPMPAGGEASNPPATHHLPGPRSAAALAPIGAGTLTLSISPLGPAISPPPGDLTFGQALVCRRLQATGGATNPPPDIMQGVT